MVAAAHGSRGRGTLFRSVGVPPCCFQAPSSARSRVSGHVGLGRGRWIGLEEPPSTRIVFLPGRPDGVQLLSARLGSLARPGRADPLPSVLVIRPHQFWLSGFRTPLLEILLWEVSHPRPGATSVIERAARDCHHPGAPSRAQQRLLERPGLARCAHGPCLRTGLNDARLESPPKSVKELASEVHRSMRRVRARVRTQSGDGPGRLLRQLRIQRALQRLERGTPRLDELAREESDM